LGAGPSAPPVLLSSIIFEFSSVVLYTPVAMISLLFGLCLLGAATATALSNVEFYVFLDDLLEWWYCC